MVQLSVKERILLAAERLFAERGLDGASLRQISAAAHNGNNTAVQYHFGSKERLIQAIFEYRLRDLNERRAALIGRGVRRSCASGWSATSSRCSNRANGRAATTSASWRNSSSTAKRDVLDRLAPELLAPTHVFRERAGALLPHLPEPLRGHRIAHAMAFSVYAGAEREQSRARDEEVLPYAVHVGDLLDGLVGFLQAPVSSATASALAGAGAREIALPVHP